MDIEGYEATILDPVSVPALMHATILVEFHDNMIENCREVILNRFAETHTHTQYEPRHRTEKDYPIASIRKNGMLKKWARLAITERPIWREGRHGWILLEPKVD